MEMTTDRTGRRMQVFIGVFAVVFTIGTALHNFLIIDTAVIEQMMREAGGADPAGDAPGFLSGFRVVGTVYIVANAVGIAALWARPKWLYWWVLAVNATQGLGWVMIPTVMWSVVADRYGPLGILPSAVTDGGAVVVAIVMIAVLVRSRAVWGMARALIRLRFARARIASGHG
ncbi:hypothetical protein AB0B28_06885 [Glycomyces sp. NPDC046736]|uniref:hypothetical protein n=1 Tax=Glycomyces sp. NPDC046736 TaxID=3155615 RepID=UPI0033E89868